MSIVTQQLFNNLYKSKCIHWLLPTVAPNNAILCTGHIHVLVDQACSQVSTMGGHFLPNMVSIAEPCLLCMALLVCTHCVLGLVTGAETWSYNRKRCSPGPRTERGGPPTPSTPPAYGPVDTHELMALYSYYFSWGLPLPRNEWIK